MGSVQIVLVSALLSIVYSACPSGWQPHGGSCYKFQTEIQNWVDARIMCKRHGSDLITIETAAEQTWFREQCLKFNHTQDDDGFWLGATDWTTEGTWVWETTQKQPTYIVWGQGQPNNRNNSENCMAAVKYFDYVWSDEFCNWQRVGYVCEMAEPSDPLVG